jgi:hypothetical protein
MEGHPDMQRNGFGLLDGTSMTFGAIATLQYLRRVGTEIIGVTTTIAGILRETSGPTDLTLGAVADTQMLVRSGATVIGAAPGMSQAQVLTRISFGV